MTPTTTVADALISNQTQTLYLPIPMILISLSQNSKAISKLLKIPTMKQSANPSDLKPAVPIIPSVPIPIPSIPSLSQKTSHSPQKNSLSIERCKPASTDTMPKDPSWIMNLLPLIPIAPETPNATQISYSR